MAIPYNSIIKGKLSMFLNSINSSLTSEGDAQIIPSITHFECQLTNVQNPIKFYNDLEHRAYSRSARASTRIFKGDMNSLNEKAIKRKKILLEILFERSEHIYKNRWYLSEREQDYGLLPSSVHWFLAHSNEFYNEQLDKHPDFHFIGLERAISLNVSMDNQNSCFVFTFHRYLKAEELVAQAYEEIEGQEDAMSIHTKMREKLESMKKSYILSLDEHNPNYNILQLKSDINSLVQPLIKNPYNIIILPELDETNRDSLLKTYCYL